MNSVYIIFKRFGTRRVLKIRSSRGIEIIGASACLERPHGWPKMVDPVSIKSVIGGRRRSRSRKGSSSTSTTSTGSSSGSSSSTSSCSRRPNSVDKEKKRNVTGSVTAQPNSLSVDVVKSLRKDGDSRGALESSSMKETVRKEDGSPVASNTAPIVEGIKRSSEKNIEAVASAVRKTAVKQKPAEPIVLSDSERDRLPHRV